MRGRLVVFPVKGRKWCFTRAIDAGSEEAAASVGPTSFRQLWESLSTSHSTSHNAQLLVDFASTKMHKAWIGLEKAPDGSFKNKIHGLGLKLLERLKPSEIFLKSISKEVTSLHITYPSSLNARLVRRRLRHVAMSVTNTCNNHVTMLVAAICIGYPNRDFGAVIHKKYFYGSVSLLPVTTAFTVLPLPNVPFFWVLFRTYSHWQALKGSEKLLWLVSDKSYQESLTDPNAKENEHDDSKHKTLNPGDSSLELEPSEELDELLKSGEKSAGISETEIRKICKHFGLKDIDIMKFLNKT